jgi:restriction system protein
MMLARRAAIQQVVAGAIMHGCAATMVVCSTKFSAAAQRLANAHGCVLVDRSGLEEFVLDSR